MGLFDNLFGGRKNYEASIKQMEKGYAGARAFSSSGYDKIIQSFIDERANNAAVYSDAYQSAVKQYTDAMAKSQEQFAAAGKEAYKTLESGRDATLALLKQQTDSAIGRAQISGMLTGLSNTTFGQNQINAVAAQGALQAGAVQEQYAQTLASAQMSQAAAMANMQRQTGQSLFAANLGNAQYQSGLYQQYTAALQGARTGQLTTGLELMTKPIENRYQADLNKAMMDMQAGNALGGALLGGALGAVGGMVGGPMGAGIGSSLGKGLAGG